MTDAERIERLRQLRAIFDELTSGALLPSPAKRLALQLSDETDRLMKLRGVTWGSARVRRSTLARCLKGANVTLASVSDVADAFGCDVELRFVDRPRGLISATVSRRYATAPLSDVALGSIVDPDITAPLSADVCTHARTGDGA